LEAQLEQERLHHEQELQTLRQLHKDAERNMGVTLAETLESAETERHQYEDRLRALEHQINEARHRAVESEMNSQEKAALVGRLESEKQVKNTNITCFSICIEHCCVVNVNANLQQLL
jgi:hypothetical protein